ncbi:MAG: hypothetical protein Q8Q14_04970 [Gemmatimonadales bacterium]|nr:hypothetical protein [Gemmatimonadales bacterium]
MKRGWAALLLTLQAIGSGAVTLAHARDVLDAPAALEAAHDGNCPVLHDGPRCALCQYAGVRVVPQQAVVWVAPTPARTPVVWIERAVASPASIWWTPPSRAPPLTIS